MYVPRAEPRNLVLPPVAGPKALPPQASQHPTYVPGCHRYQYEPHETGFIGEKQECGPFPTVTPAAPRSPQASVAGVPPAVSGPWRGQAPLAVGVGVSGPLGGSLEASSCCTSRGVTLTRQRNGPCFRPAAPRHPLVRRRPGPGSAHSLLPP